MQINNIQPNNTSFGAKLVINDCEGLLRGINRPGFCHLKKFRAFSDEQLREVEKIFEQKTKNVKGKLELTPQWRDDWRGGEEFSSLYYFPNRQYTIEQIRKSPKNERYAYAPVRIFKKGKMPKSVDEFADKLIGALFAMKHRFQQTQQIHRLEAKIENLRRTQEENTLEELGKYLKIKHKEFMY